MQARRGELVDVLEGSGLVAEIAGEAVGLVTWFVAGAREPAEVRALVVRSAARRKRIGWALLDAAVVAMRGAGLPGAWLVTTNDNLGALALYQRAGWRLAALRPGAIDELRRTLKPSIPVIGDHGIPLRDELELELDLKAGLSGEG